MSAGKTGYKSNCWAKYICRICAILLGPEKSKSYSTAICYILCTYERVCEKHSISLWFSCSRFEQACPVWLQPRQGLA